MGQGDKVLVATVGFDGEDMNLLAHRLEGRAATIGLGLPTSVGEGSRSPLAPRYTKGQEDRMETLAQLGEFLDGEGLSV